MHYTGTIYTSGEKFDSSRDRNSPFEFNLGRGEVIQGWDRGLSNMCVGEKRKLTIPSDLGYGGETKNIRDRDKCITWEGIEYAAT